MMKRRFSQFYAKRQNFGLKTNFLVKKKLLHITLLGRESQWGRSLALIRPKKC